jgi:hypothetical protein
MEHFVLPPEYNKCNEEGNVILGGRERRRLVKEFALKKMGEAFRTFKKNLVWDYVSKQNTPEFKGQYEKLRAVWPKFVAQKESEHAKAVLKINKKNAQKKEYHHIMGPGGYRTSLPNWEKMENSLRDRGIPLGKEGWDPRAKNGGTGMGDR